MIPSIVAVDGSTLDLVPVRDANGGEAARLQSKCLRLRGKFLFLDALYCDRFSAMQNSISGVWLLQRRGEKAYCGLCYCGYVKVTNTIYPVVVIAPEYRGNGYGRAALVAMCVGTCATSVGYVCEESKFCEDMGMKRHDRAYYASTDTLFPSCREVITWS